MVRQKKTAISPRKDAEIKAKMEQITQKCKIDIFNAYACISNKFNLAEKDLKDLELIKRAYSTEFVADMAIQFGKIVHEVELNLSISHVIPI